MSKVLQPQALLFDMDGTLFQSESILIPAYEKTFDALRAKGLHVGQTPPVESMLRCLGMVLDEIWNRICPGMSESTKRIADELFMQYQLEALSDGLGRLYPGVLEGLRRLKEDGYRLFVASNGQERYVSEIVRQLNMEGLFDDLYSAGKFKTASKVDLVRLLLDQHGLETAWMVGDRSSDVEAGVCNRLPVVGCLYAAFGADAELEGSTFLIRSFDALMEIVAIVEKG